MSRADEPTLPPPPRLRRVVVEALGDLAYNSWRFFGANVLFGVVLIVIVLAAVGTAWALALLPLAAVPAAGIMRMATVLVREGHVDFGDAAAAMRRPGLPLAIGAAQAVFGLVLVIDMQIGAAIGSSVGVILTVSAVYGLLIGWAYSAIAWPLLLDPERDGESIAMRLKLAALVLVAHPIRVGGVLVLVGIVLGVSALAIAPVVTFTVALAWLIIARFVLPVADRIEGRRTLAVDR